MEPAKPPHRIIISQSQWRTMCEHVEAAAPEEGCGILAGHDGWCAAVLPLLSPEKGTQVSKILQALILMVSGIYYPVTVLPGWLQGFSAICPATYALEGIRLALLDGAGMADLLPVVVTLAVIGAVMMPIGLLVFGMGENYAKRAGLLKRNG